LNYAYISFADANIRKDYNEDYHTTSADKASNNEAEWAKYEAYLHRELPSSLRRELEKRVDGLFDSAEQTLKCEIPE
jgi:tRNA 2-selenouridine synthase SelU